MKLSNIAGIVGLTGALVFSNFQTLQITENSVSVSQEERIQIIDSYLETEFVLSNEDAYIFWQILILEQDQKEEDVKHYVGQKFINFLNGANIDNDDFIIAMNYMNEWIHINKITIEGMNPDSYKQALITTAHQVFEI